MNESLLASVTYNEYPFKRAYPKQGHLKDDDELKNLLQFLINNECSTKFIISPLKDLNFFINLSLSFR
jgi:hypothetical protein